MSEIAAFYTALLLALLVLALLWARNRRRSPMAKTTGGSASDQTLYCSFCGKSQNEVAKLIAGPSVFICDECVDLCADIVREDYKAVAVKASAGQLVPGDIYRVLDRQVNQLRRAKRILALSGYERLHRSNEEANYDLGKPNILLIGTAGSGKRLLAQSLASVLCVPSATINARALIDPDTSTQAWQALIGDLLKAADFNVEAAERGVVCIHAVDKACQAEIEYTEEFDPSSKEFQEDLSTYIRGRTVSWQLPYPSTQPASGTLDVSTTNILFVLAGSFIGLESREAGARHDSLAGFEEQIDPQECRHAAETLRTVAAGDLQLHGLVPDLVDQLPYVASLREWSD